MSGKGAYTLGRQMNLLWTIVYIAAVVIFIAWLLFAMRNASSGKRRNNTKN